MQICPLIIFVGFALFMLNMMNDFTSGFPDWAQAPDLSFFTWFVYAILGFAIIATVSNIVRQLKRTKTSDTSIRYESRIDTYSAEDVTSYEASGYAAPTYIRVIPNFCSNCASKLTDSTVEWIGSMSFTCPHCGKQQDAERKAI